MFSSFFHPREPCTTVRLKASSVARKRAGDVLAGDVYRKSQPSVERSFLAEAQLTNCVALIAGGLLVLTLHDAVFNVLASFFTQALGQFGSRMSKEPNVTLPKWRRADRR